MPMRSIFVVTGLALAATLGGCATSVDEAWTAPGWYLERPRALVMAHPAYLAGPYSYEECEAARQPDQLLCNNRKAKPSET
jgi:hypothetical protein